MEVKMVLLTENRIVIGCIKEEVPFWCWECCLKLVCRLQGLEVKGKWAYYAQQLKRRVENADGRTGDSEDAPTR